MRDATQTGWVAWFTRNPVAANLLMVFILAMGVITAFDLRIEDFPSRPPSSLEISVSHNSGSAKTTEEAITIKLEEALNGVPGIKKISSTSSGSGTSITVDRTSDYDLDVLYQDVKNRIDSVDTLPTDAEKPIISRQLDVENAVSVHLFGSVDQGTLQANARILKDRLIANPAIEDVVTNGRQTPEIVIQIDEQQLQSLNLTLADIAQSVASASITESGGELYSEESTIIVKADSPKYWQREFERIPIKETPLGEQVFLSDVAVIDDGFEQSGMISRFNGQRAIELSVLMYGNSDVMQVSEQVNAEVEAFKPHLSKGIDAKVWNDSSIYIIERLGLLVDNSLIGIVLVMFMLSLMLNVRVAFWVGAGLPVIFAGGLLLLGPNFYNLTLNEITTFGFIIALGIVVDDAVVVGESIYAQREKYGATIESTIRGAQRVTVPTVFGVLTTIVAFMALALIKGDMGKIFAMFGYAAAFCLAFSLIESKLILPAHLAHIRMQPLQTQNPLILFWRGLQSRVSQVLTFWIRNLYRPLIHQVLHYRYATLAIAISIFILVVGMVPSGKIHSTFFPDIPENTIQVALTMEDDAGYALAQRHAIHIEEAGLRISQQLQDEYNLDVPPIPSLMTLTTDNSAELVAEMSPVSERPFDTNHIADLWEAEVGTLEGMKRLRFVTDHEDESDISIELRSQNPEVLEATSQQVSDALTQYTGVAAVQSTLKASQQQIDLKLLPAGRALGLSEESLAQQVQQAYQGIEAIRTQRGRDEVKVKVRYPDQQRRNITDLEKAYIRTPDGQTLPLLSVSQVSSGYVATEIERIDRSRVAVITADLDKESANSNQILESMEANLFTQLRSQYPGLRIELTGEAQEEAEVTESLEVAFGIALLAIYALLAIPLKSYTQPLLIMSVIPFGIIGALLGLWLHNLPLSILAMFGILALSGVVVNDSLLLISRYNENRQQGKPTKLAMIEAGCGRMRAIVLTSLTTYVGLLPLIFDKSDSAQMLIPAAVAMGYGILFATLLTLILIPTLVLISEDIKGKTQVKENNAVPSPSPTGIDQACKVCD